MPRKHFLATYAVIDGEHTSVGRLLISACSGEVAWTFGESLAHDAECWDDCSEEHPWSYFDGSTASQLSEMHEVSEEEFAIAKNAVGLSAYEAK
jgi:hypothetical protein